MDGHSVIAFGCGLPLGDGSELGRFHGFEFTLANMSRSENNNISYPQLNKNYQQLYYLMRLLNFPYLADVSCIVSQFTMILSNAFGTLAGSHKLDLELVNKCESAGRSRRTALFR